MRINIILAFLVLGFSTMAQKVGVKSYIDFEVSNFKVNTVEGNLSDISGVVKFDLADVNSSSFKIKIGISSINTENEERDEHLQAEEFFNAEKYPKATFTSTSVSKEGEDYVVKGELTIKGITQSVSIPFKYTELKGGFLLSGPLTVDRYDFKVGESSSFTIGRDIDLTIHCYLVN